jgi:uncharacterized glyoxalase superfamily protein PhnB
MNTRPTPTGVIPYVFCADAGATADWCVATLGCTERQRWPDTHGVVRNVELVVGTSEVWLDGPVRDWKDNTSGHGSWIGFLVDDVDAVYEALVADGIELEPPTTCAHGVREIGVTDPEGHTWGFIQRLD